jgi:hypothetical protein
MNKHEASPNDIRSLSNDVLEIAHAGLKGEISGEAWQRLIAGGLMLRKLAGIEMPWEHSEK